MCIPADALEDVQYGLQTVLGGRGAGRSGGVGPGGGSGDSGLPVRTAATAERAPALADLIDGLGAEGRRVDLLRVSTHRSERLPERKEEEEQGVTKQGVMIQGGLQSKGVTKEARFLQAAV